MKCKVCRHEASEHPRHHDNDDYCNVCNLEYARQCYISQDEIERDAWKAEALAARKMEKLHEEYIYALGPDMAEHRRHKYEEARRQYYAVRVEDEQP